MLENSSPKDPLVLYDRTILTYHAQLQIEHMIFQGVVFHVETDTRIIPGLTIIRPYQVRPDKIFLPALLGANLQQDRLSIAISIAIPSASKVESTK